MKVNLRTIIGILGGVVMASCSTTIDEPDTSQTSIQFGTAVSRAAVIDENGLSSFSVWGGYDNIKLFEGTTVDKTASGWTYGGGTRYWIPGKTFNFYAVHPATLPEGSVADVTDVAGNGTITVTGFDCSKTGAEAVDLMTAKKTGIIYTSGSQVQPVGLEFGHELARVNIIVNSEAPNVMINSIAVTGVGYKGNYNNGQWNYTGFSDGQTPNTYTKTDVSLQQNIESNIYGDMLLLPLASEQLSNSKLKIDYTYKDSGNKESKEISLVTAVVTSWIKSNSYKYTLTIPKDSETLKLNVSVLPWDKQEDASIDW